MKISKPRILEDKDTVTYTVDVEIKNNVSPLWYRLPRQYSYFVSDSSDAALVALLAPAMEEGEDIYMEGSISEKLLYNLSNSYQPIIRHVIPWLKSVKINANKFYKQEAKGAYVITGFSGGVDSYCTIADHLSSDIPESFQITHFLFSNVGSHGSGEGGEKLFLERYNRLNPVTQNLGKPFIWVNSNLDSFYGKSLYFMQTNGLRNVSVGLLLQKGFSKYLYSSTDEYKEVFVGRAHDTAYSDPITLPLLSTENIDHISVGCRYTRVQKTLRISKFPITHDTLDVCVDPEGKGNCSKCFKCLRTLLTLEIAEILDLYSKSFRLEVYRKNRDKFIVQVINSDIPLLKEIVSFAKERDYSFPLKCRLIAKYNSFRKAVLSLVRFPFRALKRTFKILK